MPYLLWKYHYVWISLKWLSINFREVITDLHWVIDCSYISEGESLLQPLHRSSAWQGMWVGGVACVLKVLTSPQPACNHNAPLGGLWQWPGDKCLWCQSVVQELRSGITWHRSRFVITFWGCVSHNLSNCCYKKSLLKPIVFDMFFSLWHGQVNVPPLDMCYVRCYEKFTVCIGILKCYAMILFPEDIWDVWIF